MKKAILLIIVMIFTANINFAQDFENGLYPDKDNSIMNITPKFYVGLGSGLFYRTGLLGGIVEYHPVPNVYLTSSLGLGGWGYKAAIGGRYLYKDVEGFGISMSYYLATGGVDLELENTNSSSSNNTVKLGLRPAHGINFSLAYHFLILQKHRLGFEFGYTFQINQDAYVIKSINQPDEVVDFTLQLMQPGGFGMGMFFVFG